MHEDKFLGFSDCVGLLHFHVIATTAIIGCMLIVGYFWQHPLALSKRPYQRRLDSPYWEFGDNVQERLFNETILAYE